MNYLIIDLETSGIPASRYPNYNDNNGYKNSRIVQVAMILCDSSYHLIDEMNYIIKRDGFDIPNSHIHNITNEISDTGSPFVSTLPRIHEFVSKCSIIIAHNIDFDINILLNELYRIKASETIALIQSKIKICTMESTKRIVNAKNVRGHLKNPRLGELYEYCYPTLKFDEKHEAGHDVKMVLDILKIIGNKIINTNPIVNIPVIVNTITDETIVPFGKYKGKKVKELPLDYIIYLQNIENPFDNALPFIKYFENRKTIKPVFTGTITNRLKYVNKAMYSDIINNIFANKIKSPVVDNLGLNQTTIKFIQEIRAIDSRFCGVYIETLFNLSIRHLVRSTGTDIFQVDPLVYPDLVITTLDFLKTLACNDCILTDYKLCNKHSKQYVELVPNIAEQFGNNLELINMLYDLDKLKILKELGIYDKNDAFTIALRFAMQTDDFYRTPTTCDNIKYIMQIIQQSNRSEILNNLIQIIKFQFSDLDKIQIHKSISKPIPIELDILYNNHIIELKCISSEKYYKCWLQLLAQSYYLDKPGIISIFNFNTNEKITIDVANISKEDIKKYLDILDNKQDIDSSIIKDVKKVDDKIEVSKTIQDKISPVKKLNLVDIKKNIVDKIDMSKISNINNTKIEVSKSTINESVSSKILPFDINVDVTNKKSVNDDNTKFDEFVKECNKKLNVKGINITYDHEYMSIRHNAQYIKRSFHLRQKRINNDISQLVDMLEIAWLKYCVK